MSGTILVRSCLAAATCCAVAGALVLASSLWCPGQCALAHAVQSADDRVVLSLGFVVVDGRLRITVSSVRTLDFYTRARNPEELEPSLFTFTAVTSTSESWTEWLRFDGGAGNTSFDPRASYRGSISYAFLEVPGIALLLIGTAAGVISARCRKGSTSRGFDAGAKESDSGND